MLIATLLWSIAGVVTRHLEAARSFEVTFWRSAFNVLALTVALLAMRGPQLLADLHKVFASNTAAKNHPISPPKAPHRK